MIGCDEAVKPMLASRIIDGEGIPARIREKRLLLPVHFY